MMMMMTGAISLRKHHGTLQETLLVGFATLLGGIAAQDRTSVGALLGSNPRSSCRQNDKEENAEIIWQ